MRKLDKKGVSSLPRIESDFEGALQKYLGVSTNIPILAIQSIKNQTAALPLRREPNFEKWFNQTVAATKEILKDLYIKYDIPPGVILDTLAFAELYDRLPSLEVKAKLRSLKRRDKDARILEKAADILREYQPLLMQRTLPGVLSLSSLQIGDPETGDKGAEPMERRNIWLPTRYESGEISDTIEEVAQRIRELGPSTTHRPKEVKLSECAKTLASIFKHFTRWPSHEYVGNLIHAAFPEQWSPKGDIREAAKQLIKGKKGTRGTRSKPSPKEQLDPIQDKSFDQFIYYLKQITGSTEAQMEVGKITRKIPGRWATVTVWLKDLKTGKSPEQVWDGLPKEIKQFFCRS